RQSCKSASRSGSTGRRWSARSHSTIVKPCNLSTRTVNSFPASPRLAWTPAPGTVCDSVPEEPVDPCVELLKGQPPPGDALGEDAGRGAFRAGSAAGDAPAAISNGGGVDSPLLTFPPAAKHMRGFLPDPVGDDAVRS